METTHHKAKCAEHLVTTILFCLVTITPPLPDDPLLRLRDRARGCIIGGTLGDAMGGPFEGQPGPIRFQQHAEWCISDDSQLTLATCESIIEAGKVSAPH